MQHCNCQQKIIALQHRVDELSYTVQRIIKCIEFKTEEKLIENSFDSFLLEGLQSSPTERIIPDLPLLGEEFQSLNERVRSLEEKSELVPKLKNNVSMLTKIL